MEKDHGCGCHNQADCCSQETKSENHAWIVGSISTPIGDVPLVSHRLSRKDVIGRWKARWGIDRMNYNVNPGLYAIGNPTAESPVFVSANYKMSFDILRHDLAGIDGWILVLDTKGINVWCAAGKGTFGTQELVHRIADSRLPEIVSHRKLIVPQLGAPGVAAHTVKKESGFLVEYGPVLSRDIMDYLENDHEATDIMRRVPFGFKDRAVLIPMELVPAMKYFPYVALIVLAVQLIVFHTFNLESILILGPFLGAILMGSVIFELALPIMPFRSFVLNGWILGLILSWILYHYCSFSQWNNLSWFFLLPPLTAYLAENFTGTTTFTHLSGVKLELKLGVPIMVVSIVIGLVLQFI